MRKVIKYFIFITILFTFCVQISFGLGKLSIEQINLDKYEKENIIEVIASVYNDNGIPIKNLNNENFNLKVSTMNYVENINNFSVNRILSESEPLYLSILIDCSESVLKNDSFTKIKKASIEFIKNCRDVDKIMLITFSDEVNILTDFTNDKEGLIQKINDINIGEYTKLYDALNISLEKLKDISSPRKTIILLSDGKDSKELGYISGSNSTSNDVLRKSELYNVSIYAIGFTDFDYTFLDRITKLTNGQLFVSEDTSNLNLIYSKIYEALKDQYLIEFVDPKPSNGKELKKLILEVKVDNDSAITEKNFVVNKPKKRPVVNKIVIYYFLPIVILIIVFLFYILKRRSSVNKKSKLIKKN